MKMEDYMRNTVSCPLCPDKEFTSFLNLARHMVLKDRPDGPHQQWLSKLLNRRFAEYAFGKDKAISMKLKAYWDKYKSWPDITV